MRSTTNYTDSSPTESQIRKGTSRREVKKYIDTPEDCLKTTQTYQRTSIIDPYHSTIKAWLDEDEYYTATWIYDRLVNQGYTGSYETVKHEHLLI